MRIFVMGGGGGGSTILLQMENLDHLFQAFQVTTIFGKSHDQNKKGPKLKLHSHMKIENGAGSYKDCQGAKCDILVS